MTVEGEVAGQGVMQRGWRVCEAPGCDRVVRRKGSRGPVPSYCDPAEFTWPDGQSCKAKAAADRAARQAEDDEPGLEALRRSQHDLDATLQEWTQPLAELTQALTAAREEQAAVRDGLLERVAAAERDARNARDEREAALAAQAEQTQLAADATAEAEQARRDRDSAVAERTEAHREAARDRSARERMQGTLEEVRQRASAAEARAAQAELDAAQQVAKADARATAAERKLTVQRATSRRLQQQVDELTARTAAEQRRTRRDAETTINAMRTQADQAVAAAREETRRVQDAAEQRAERQRERDAEFGKLTERLAGTTERLQQTARQLESEQEHNRTLRAAVLQALHGLREGRHDAGQAMAGLEKLLYYADDAAT
ncbi:hypothetical protein HUO13_20720 [Saccharopolyspora erythraea]|uniref:hypothetical protein n=1 Tax=Saccharopolyspora erythraea TaxID=1836 RepID=UPI001BAC0909|nr:hypothetical protein [Saccharopolyspora erythraea]QUH02915.1 hypothetical protein HUO13_20720 [Saccharopolyspora erythraea]